MKKNCLVGFVLLCLCLVSCATSNVSRLDILNGHSEPSWYGNTSRLAGKNKIAFTGKGVSLSVRQAELLAYTNLCENISKYTGSPVEEEDYRELTTDKTLSSLGLKVKKTYTSYNGANYMFYVGAVADESSFDGHRSPEVIEHYRQLEEIERLILEGDSCIKNGNYVGAVKKYLQSMAISYYLDDVEQEYSYYEILKEVKSILESMFFLYKPVRQNSSDLAVTLWIKESIIPAEVGFADILASFSVRDFEGNSYTEKFVYTTDNLGKFVFSPSVFKSESDGNVTFFFSVLDEIDVLMKIDPQNALELRKTVEEKSFSYEYEKPFEKDSVVVSELWYRDNGTFIDSEPGMGLVSKFVNEGATCYRMLMHSDAEDSELLEFAKKNYTGTTYLMILKVEMTQLIDLPGGGKAALADGYSELYSISSGELIAQTGMMNSTGFGENTQKAMENAFESLENMAFNFIRTAYV